MAILIIVGVVLMAVGLILHIVGLATPDWEVFDASGTKLTYGLWQFCARSTCVTFWSVTIYPEVQASEAFSIIGVLLGMDGLEVALYHLFLIVTDKPKNKTVPMMAAVLGCLALGVVLITVIVWGVVMHKDRLKSQSDLGYSFILSIIGGSLTAIGGVVVFMAKKIGF